jgi:hypothetical protein
MWNISGNKNLTIPKGDYVMKIPEFCGVDEFVRSLNNNRQMIDRVLKTFDAGAFSKPDLEKLTMATRRTAHVCRELIKMENSRKDG